MTIIQNGKILCMGNKFQWKSLKLGWNRVKDRKKNFEGEFSWENMQYIYRENI